jgi:ubiquinone/menaquinone biosynthesis C-methylase UbiE
MNRYLEIPLLTYSTARSLHYALQYRVLNTISKNIPGLQTPHIDDEPTRHVVRTRLINLLKQDVQNIITGLYPVTVLQPESPLTHVRRLSSIFWDGITLYRRRKLKKTKQFSKEAKSYIEDVPEYYRRNFHFQTDGYLTERSAELYEHQVELLFGGSADAMRRLLLRPMKDFFAKSPTGRGLTFLEIGAGTGRATFSVKQAFPDAKIVVTDLSEPYLRLARQKMANLRKIDFVQTDGADLPFNDLKFDAVYSVFMFHEIPESERKKILKESSRVLKKGGFIAVVDSCQLGDVPELDHVFKAFPANFHEPFYMNYISRPVEKALKAEKFKVLGSETGFFSKVTWAKKT